MTKIPFTIGSLHQAFKKVKTNHGRPGVDGISIEWFEKDLDLNLSLLSWELESNHYCPLPLLKILVEKSNGETRGLSIPTVKDRVAQTSLLIFLEPILEKEFEQCSFAYRKGRSVRQAVFLIREYYNQGYRWVVEADIDAFFDQVDHNCLFKKIEKFIPHDNLVALIQAWVKAEVWDGKSLQRVEKGIPQGSPVSPILANLFLDELDEAFLQNGYRLVRYSDDFIVLCRNPEEGRKVLEFTREILDNLFLKLDEAEVVSFDQGFKFLGVTFFRSMVMIPFDRPRKPRKVIYIPPPLNLEAYLLTKQPRF
jgi:RNA-directed DNA polymerase